MTTTENRYPVDSTYHPCCNAIGRHGRDCKTQIQPPPGAEPDLWVAGQRDIYSQIGYVATSTDLLSCPAVTVVAEQYADGRIGCIDVILDVEMGGSHSDLSSAHARELAGMLTAGADLADTWAGNAPTTDTRLSTAKAAVMEAYNALKLVPGNAGDYLRAALDSIDDAIEAVAR
jgi:hypothetical protein